MIDAGTIGRSNDIITSNYMYAADAEASDAYVVNLPAAPEALSDGTTVRFKANTANTGPATLNLNSLGAAAILRANGDPLGTGDIVANQLVEVSYRNGNWYMMSQLGQLPSFASGIVTRSLGDASGAQNIAHGLSRAPRFVRLTAAYAFGSGLYKTFSVGTFDGTTNRCIFSATSSDGNLNANGNASTYAIRIHRDATNSYQTGVITVDGTNITVTWTKTGTPTGDVEILWEAYE